MADPIVTPIPKRNYGDRLTLDLDTPLPKTIPEGCLSLKNMLRRRNKSMAKRPGVKMQHASEPGTFNADEVFVGAHAYVYSNDVYGSTEEMLIIGGGDVPGVYKEIDTKTLGVNYAGAGTASIKVVANAAGLWEVSLYVNSVLVTGYPKTYANGIGTAGSLLDLGNDIDALANWSVSTLGDFGVNYPLISSMGTVPLTNLVGALTPDFSTGYSAFYSSIPYLTPELTITNVGPDSDYANLKGINIVNTMLMPMGKRLPVLKFDGQQSYKPGLPRATLVSVAADAGGTSHPLDGVYIIRVGFWREDFRGNQIYGPYSDDTLAVATHTMAAAKDLNVTFNTLYRAGGDSLKAYDPRSAVVNGLQAGVRTITVDSGHTIGGDSGGQLPTNVKFYDGITSSIVTRTIISVTATTITFAASEATVNVADNAVISNIMAQIQSTVSTGIDFFEVENIPVNTLTSTQVYKITTQDANLGSNIEEQILLPEPPPNAKLCCIHQGLVVFANLEDDPQGVTWNDKEWGYEAYPPDKNRDQVVGKSGGEITGIISESDSSLAVFKKNGYYKIEGDLATGQYIVTELSDNTIGISSHASLVKLPDALGGGIMGISEDGPVLIKDGNISTVISYGTHDLFEDIDYNVAQGSTIEDEDEEKLVPERSTAAYFPTHKIVVFFIPAESGIYRAPENAGVHDPMARYANENSVWLCYDIVKNEWYDWEFDDENINAHLSMEVFKNKLYFISSNAAGKAGNNFVWRFNDSRDINGYVDNTKPIEWAPKLQWESLGNPSTEKKMSSLKVYAKHAKDFIAPFTLSIKEYRNDDNNTVYLDAERFFNSAADTEKIIDPLEDDFVSQAIEFYNNELYECPVLSGFEMEYKTTTSPEIKDVRGDG